MILFVSCLMLWDDCLVNGVLAKRLTVTVYLSEVGVGIIRRGSVGVGVCGGGFYACVVVGWCLGGSISCWQFVSIRSIVIVYMFIKKAVIVIVTVIVILNIKLNFIPFQLILHRNPFPHLLLSFLSSHLPLPTITLPSYWLPLTLTKRAIWNCILFFHYTMWFAAFIIDIRISVMLNIFVWWLLFAVTNVVVS